MPALSRRSQSTLPSTVCSSRIQMSKIGAVIL
jgi:hypothetical protein